MTFKVEMIKSQKEETSDFMIKAYQHIKQSLCNQSKWTVDRENRRILILDFTGHTMEDCDEAFWTFIDNEDVHTLHTLDLLDEKNGEHRTLSYKLIGHHKNGKKEVINTRDLSIIEEALSANGRAKIFDLDHYKSCHAKITI